MKKDVLHITIVLAHIIMFGLIWTNMQKYNVHVILNENPTHFEPISYIEPSIEQLIMETFGEDGTVALAIAKAESTLRPEICHIDEREYSCGIFQINLRAHYKKVPGIGYEEKAEWLKEPENNIRIAKQLFDTSGFWPWSVWKNGAYKLWLN